MCVADRQRVASLSVACAEPAFEVRSPVVAGMLGSGKPVLVKGGQCMHLASPAQAFVSQDLCDHAGAGVAVMGARKVQSVRGRVWR
jgi:hypothetical protein